METPFNVFAKDLEMLEIESKMLKSKEESKTNALESKYRGLTNQNAKNRPI